VGKLKENNIKISMTENGDPYENAIAERINGILKYEFLLGLSFYCGPIWTIFNFFLIPLLSF
jgi:transposase InsO family protein